VGRSHKRTVSPYKHSIRTVHLTRLGAREKDRDAARKLRARTAAQKKEVEKWRQEKQSQDLVKQAEAVARQMTEEADKSRAKVQEMEARKKQACNQMYSTYTVFVWQYCTFVM
jgi:hypothetical protein